MRAWRFLSAGVARFRRKLWRGPQFGAILPVIRTQLEETSRQVEDAVVGVCGNFTGITARARQAVAESAALMDDQSSGDGATVESSIATSRRTIAALLAQLERGAQLSAMAVASMEEVSRTVTGIEDLLSQIQRIAFTNKVVALNAKIEAVHVGELGSGFEVVADEISRQAERSNDLAAGVSEHIQKMRLRMDSAAGELRAFLAEGRQELEESRGQAEGALSMLLALHQRTRDSLARVTEESSHLAGDVAAAVVGLQFQDRVKQRIEHVVEALRKLEDAPQVSAAELLDGVHSSYTMESERVAHQRAADQSPSPSSEAEMEVELF